jgi:peptidoglycan/xylan/chitin deacetylase (PgdA/CDA1 family)
LAAFSTLCGSLDGSWAWRCGCPADATCGGGQYCRRVFTLADADRHGNIDPYLNSKPPTFTPTLTPPPMPLLTPMITRDPTQRVLRVPILMYHYVSVPPPDADKYRLDLSVTPANFQAQMEYLAREGYHPIRLSDLGEFLLNGSPLPTKPIAITFDDGYTDNYQNAFPILKKYKFPATFFVITQYVDDRKTGYMTWDQLEDMAIEKMEIGSHSMTHPDLQGKPRVFQVSELAGSKLLIESRIGTSVRVFSYPAGKYDTQTIQVLRSAGYLAAVTTEPQGARQSTDAPFELQRIRIRGSFSVNDFAYWINYFTTNGK